jgi:hypothetical protein
MLTRPRTALLLLAATIPAFVALELAGARAEGELPVHAYLPLALHAVRMDQLPTAVAVSPTTSATQTSEPTATATATIYVPPSATPEPSATPTEELGATITGLLAVDHQPLWEGTGDGIGPGLFLQRCPAAGACTLVARTAVDAEGRYTFKVAEPLGPGEWYQVVWWNSTETVQDFELEGADLYLGRWFGPRITDLDQDAVVDVPLVDLGDIELLSPTAGTGFQGFPIPFSWARWPGGAGSYRWSLCRCCQTKGQRDGSYQVSVGGVTSFELTGLPRGFSWDERYCWYIQVDMGAERGYGESFAVRMMWFIPEAGEAAAPPPCGK